MPSRRRGQEAKRAAKRQAREAARLAKLGVPHLYGPMTLEEEVEAAFWQNGRGSVCCADCDPGYFNNLPEVVMYDARQEIAEFKRAHASRDA